MYIHKLGLWNSTDDQSQYGIAGLAHILYNLHDPQNFITTKLVERCLYYGQHENVLIFRTTCVHAHDYAREPQNTHTHVHLDTTYLTTHLNLPKVLVALHQKQQASLRLQHC